MEVWSMLLSATILPAMKFKLRQSTITFYPALCEEWYLLVVFLKQASKAMTFTTLLIILPAIKI
jgi:hypothetical protein